MRTRRNIARLIENPLGEDVFNNTTITDFVEGSPGTTSPQKSTRTDMIKRTI
jgi:hypothetical protein